MGEYFNHVLHGSDDDSGFSSSSTSSDFTEDTASSAGDSSGPLFELSSLMEHLPIKRGLSKFYQGKSQSFTSLANVRCLEDLVKKEVPYKRKMRPSKSYGGGLDQSQKPSFAPGPCSKTIAKKLSIGSCASVMAKRSSSNLLSSRKPPPIPVHKNL